MEHQIKLGDCLGKGAFGSVYRVKTLSLILLDWRLMAGVEFGDWADVGG
jgi:hypothetical protein